MSWLKKLFARYRIAITVVGGKDVFVPQYRFKMFGSKWYNLMPGYVNWKQTLKDAEIYISGEKMQRKQAKAYAKTIKYKYY